MSHTTEHKFNNKFAYDSPAAAISAWKSQFEPLSGIEIVPLPQSAGRILAQPVVSDTMSPPASVSAMDGYVLKFVKPLPKRVTVAGEIRIGHAPPDLPAGKALRIVTGAPIPTNVSDLIVLKREDVEEYPDYIIINKNNANLADSKPGWHIRYAGENLPAQKKILAPGCIINSQVTANLAAFGYANVKVKQKLKLAIITTGDELLPVSAKPQPWQIRDTNGPALQSMFSNSNCNWVNVIAVTHVYDDPDKIKKTLLELLQKCDALIITGGVSMGDRDYIPAIIDSIGAETIFHKLPVRPGKPLLAAVSKNAQPIIGLPGNPVSVMITARRTAVPILAHKAGLIQNIPTTSPTCVTLQSDDNKILDLWHYRPVIFSSAKTDTDKPVVELVDNKGSGDFVNIARSNGFIEIPPYQKGPGPWPYWSWTL